MPTESFEALTGLPIAFGMVWIFILGALIGSFLNVVIYRVPRELSVVFPNSACPGCGSAIKFYDNIPILSWVILRGKCRACKSGISVRYPLVEFSNAALYLVLFWWFGLSAFLPVAMLFGSAMLCLMLIDAEHMILPNVITYPLFFIFVAVRVCFPAVFGGDSLPFSGEWPSVHLASLPVSLSSLSLGVLGAFAGGGFLWSVGEIWKRLRGVDAMGLGDVKMMAAVGMLLGWKLTFLSIFLGAFVGAIAGIAMLSRQNERDMQAHIPFGIFLGLGSLVSMVCGNQLVEWYFRTFVP